MTTNVNDRVQHLQSSGYSWLPVQTLYSLADSGMSDNDIITAAEGMRQAAVNSTKATALASAGGSGTVASRQRFLGGINTNSQSFKAAQSVFGGSLDAVKTAAQQQQAASSGWRTFWEDPVLQKRPSAALALKQYLSGAVGAWPIEDKHLSHIQAQLQLQGFGQDLKADGTWNPAWSAAQNQWKDHIYNSQLAGNKPGGLSVAHAMEALSALTPTSAWNALAGWVTSLPDGARQLLGDAAGGTAQWAVDLYHGQPGGGEAGKTAGYDVNANVVNALGGDTSAREVRHTFEENGGLRLLEDASNIIMLASVMGAAGKFANAVGIERAAAAGDEVAQRLTLDAAVRGPGAVARSLSSQVGGPGIVPRALVGGVLGGGAATLAGGSPGQIGLATAGGAVVGGLSGTKVFQNIPVLGQTGPMIDKLADADGLYYKVRNFLAAPYKLSAVRLADVAFNQSLLLGAEARGLAQAQDYVGGNQSTQFSQSVEQTHVMDTVNDAIKNRLGFTVLGQHIAPSLDDLMFAFAGHGAQALGHAPSQHVGAVATALTQAGTDALGDPGILAAIQRATGKTLHGLVREAGGLDNFNLHWSNKIADMAAWWGAEQRRTAELIDTVGSAGESLSNPARLDALRGYAHEIRNDPDQLSASIAALRAQSGNEEMVVRLKRDIVLNAKKDGSQDLQGYLAANKHASQTLLPFADVPIGTVEPGMEAATSNRMLLNASGDEGGLGIALNDTLTRGTARTTINGFKSELADILSERQAIGRGQQLSTVALKANVDQELAAWNEKVNDFLFTHAGIRAQDIPHRGTEKLDLLDQWANHLAVDVVVHPDAPQFLHDAVTKLGEMGYKPVSGTDIGFRLHGPANVDVTEGGLSFQRKLAEHLGLNPTMVPDATIATHRWLGMTDAIQKGIASGDIVLPPYWDATTVMAYLKRDGIVDTSSRFKDTVRELLKVPQRKAKQEAWYDNLTGNLDVERARRELDEALQLRDLPRKKVVEALTNPTAFAGYTPASANAMTETRTLDEQLAALTTKNIAPTPAIPPMSKDSAEAVYRAIVRGSAAPQGYMLGLSRLEDMGRASLGFVGKGLKNNLGYAIANLPNKLVQVRNELRFDLSPYFSFRRISKVNAKLSAEGVAPVLEPLKVMNTRGTLDFDRTTLERIEPQLFHRDAEEAADSAGRYLESQDVFGFYNHRNFEAYAAGEWARQGLSDDEIRAKLIKVFEYGTGTTAGRTAIERSTNFLFFPWSFDKTLYRNLGGYLLDRPAQRYLVTSGVAAYAQFNADHMDGSNPLATSFYDKHLPILKEAERLNAFAHGISIGEAGGINRPLLNVFLPQSWQPTTANYQVLKRFIPAVQDLSRVLAELQDQYTIGKAALHNLFSSTKPTFADPDQSTLTYQAQLEAGFAMELKWETAYKDLIDHNTNTRNPDEKIRFPVNPDWGKYGGEPVTKANIRELVHARYPAYQPEGAIVHATSAQRTFQQYLLDAKGTPLYSYIAAFAQAADSFAGYASRGKYGTDQQAALTDSLRQAAAYIAERDPAFYALYDKSFRRSLGPLEKVSA